MPTKITLNNIRMNTLKIQTCRHCYVRLLNSPNKCMKMCAISYKALSLFMTLTRNKIFNYILAKQLLNKLNKHGSGNSVWNSRISKKTLSHPHNFRLFFDNLNLTSLLSLQLIDLFLQFRNSLHLIFI